MEDVQSSTSAASSICPRSQDQSLEDRKRFQDLFKYFRAASQSTGYVNIDIESQEGYNPDLARISSDPLLNGLAQLAACRLSCDRAFISLIDREYQYIVAESTSQMSLYDVKHHAPGAGLCVGARPLDLVAGVCAGTMPAFIDGPLDKPYLSTDNICADRTRYIINDFTLEDVYKERPYVTGFPFMRYYAEVPIKSPSGYVLGTLAVVDNKPGSGLADESFFTLNEIASTVMTHLQHLKVDQDHAQASQLLHGLQSFVRAGGAVQNEPAETLPSSEPHPDDFDRLGQSRPLTQREVRFADLGDNTSMPDGMVVPAEPTFGACAHDSCPASSTIWE